MLNDETPTACVFRCVYAVFELDLSVSGFVEFIEIMCELREALPLAQAEYKEAVNLLERFLPDPGASGNAD